MRSTVEGTATDEEGHWQELKMKEEDEGPEPGDEMKKRWKMHYGVERKLGDETTDEEKPRQGSQSLRLKRKLDNDTARKENKKRSRIQVVIPIP